MKEKQIELLQQQIDKLDNKAFDLEAWKNYTIVLLARMFGENSQKIKQIEKLDYEYNSWSLRDTSGTTSYLDTCKKLGREILEASISEIENFGIPKKTKEKGKTIDVNIILSALEDELKGSQYKSLMKLLKEKMSPDEKKRLLHEIIKELGPEAPQAILESILLNKGFVAGISE
jgi:hypothetical protein